MAISELLHETGTAVKRESLGSQVAALLRKSISTDRLPPGTRLVESEVARMLGVSRGPVRDAIKILATEGLVSYSADGSGAYITEPSLEDLEALVGLRTRMEEYALEMAMPRIQAEQIEEMRRLLTAMNEAAAQNDLATMQDLDVCFHRIIWLHTGSNRLAELLSLTLSPVLVWQMRSGWGWQAQAPSLHQSLMEALAAGDVETAKAALRTHMEYVSKKIDSMRELDASAG